MENGVNLQGITEQIEDGGSKQQEYHKDNNVILRNVTVAFFYLQYTLKTECFGFFFFFWYVKHWTYI